MGMDSNEGSNGAQDNGETTITVKTLVGTWRAMPPQVIVIVIVLFSAPLPSPLLRY